MDGDARSGHDEAARPAAPVPPPPAGPATSWSPPDAGATRPTRPAGPGIRIEPEDRDGPPLPPPVRRRRRRRRWIGAALGLVLIAVPTGFLIADLRSNELPAAADVDDGATDDRSDGGEDGGSDPGEDDRSDPGSDDDADEGDTLARPDPETLSGADALFGNLLLDVDDAERVMIGFQEEIGTVFSVPAETPAALIQELQEVATARREALLEVRDRLDDPLSDEGAEVVRARYVEHLDSWADYLAAVAEDPSLLGGEGAASGFNVVINATADAFARSLESELPPDIDPEVRAYAEGILDRGFRGTGDAQV